MPYKWEALWHVVVVLTIYFRMNKHFLFESYMYCSHSLHIFSNYIVNMAICICWIIADCLGAIQVCVGFPACLLYVGQHIWRSIVPLIFWWLKAITLNVFSDSLG